MSVKTGLTGKKGRLRRAAALAVAVVIVCVTIAASVFAAPVSAKTSKEIGGMKLINQKQAGVFWGTLDSADTLSVLEFEGQEDVPYISLREYTGMLFEDDYNPVLEYTMEGDILEISRKGAGVRVDTGKQTVSCNDWQAFMGPNAANGIPDGIVEKGEFMAIRPSVKNESTRTPAQGYEVNLKDYGVEMIRLNQDVLMPFAIAQAIFAGPSMDGFLAYNGDDFYDIVNSLDSIYGTETMGSAPNPYADRWYSGSFANRKELSPAYAKYNYAAMCLLLDLTYGHKEEKGISSFDSYLEENGMKEALLTPDPKDDVDALKQLFCVIFDSGHDAQLLSPSIFDSEGAIDKAQMIHSLLQLIGYDTVGELTGDMTPLIEALIKLLPEDIDLSAAGGEDGKAPDVGPNVTNMIEDMLHLTRLKPFGYGPVRVDIEGDTCVIYFEGFEEDLNRAESFYAKLPTGKEIETSSFGLFYYAFEKIKQDGNVKKVVIDLSDNGGGSAAALVATLGFLSSDGEVKFTYRDLLNGNYCTEYYHVDTNLDGKFDDADGYGGQYDFYILTTGASYSCGTAFPYFAQKEHLAKIIGEQPGGGDCVVASYVDACGHVGAISGSKQIGTMEGDKFISDETAVTVDIPLTREQGDEIYFHPEKIAQALP